MVPNPLVVSYPHKLIILSFIVVLTGEGGVTRSPLQVMCASMRVVKPLRRLLSSEFSSTVTSFQ